MPARFLATLTIAALCSAATFAETPPAPNPTTPAASAAVTPEQAEQLFRAQDWPKAIAAFEYLTKTDPTKGLYWQRFGHALHAAGRLDEAMPIHEKAATFPDTRQTALYNIACIHAMRKQNDDAFRRLNAAFDAGMTERYYFENDADLANIRSDPRFAAILQRVTDAERKRDADATQVAVVVHKGVELLDFAGPAEVFAHARKDGRRACHVFTVAPQPGPCVTGQGVTVAPDFTIDTCPRIDILVIPGGATQNLTKDKKFMDWVRTKFADTKIVMTVCTGAFTLADQGLLDDLAATTHFSAIPALRRASSAIEVKEGARWVDNGHVITTAGISAGIDGALQVVSRLYGKEAAQSAAHDMEYDWQPENRPGFTRSNASRALGHDYSLVARTAPSASSFESVAHYRDLYFGSKRLGTVGKYFISPTGQYALFEQSGKLQLFDRKSQLLTDVTDAGFAIPERVDWNEEQGRAGITYYEKHAPSTISLRRSTGS